MNIIFSRPVQGYATVSLGLPDEAAQSAGTVAVTVNIGPGTELRVSQQFSDAISFADQVYQTAAAQGTPLYFAGWSLGGGLAIAQTIAINSNYDNANTSAIVFNTEALSWKAEDNYEKAAGLDPTSQAEFNTDYNNQSMIQSFTVATDPLNAFQVGGKIGIGQGLTVAGTLYGLGSAILGLYGPALNGISLASFGQAVTNGPLPPPYTPLYPTAAGIPIVSSHFQGPIMSGLEVWANGRVY